MLENEIMHSFDYLISRENKLSHQFQDPPATKQNNLFSKEKGGGESAIEKLKDFCGYTTAHGFGRLVESKSFVRKLFWVMALLGAFTMFTCQVVWLAEDYIRKPVETYIAIKHVRVRVLFKSFRWDASIFQ